MSVCEWECSVQAEQLGTQNERQSDGQHQHRFGGAGTELLADLVGGIHIEMAHARNQVVQVAPDQGQHHELDKPARHKAQPSREGGCETFVGNFGRQRCIEHPDDERHQQKHHGTADAVQDGNPACRREPVGRQIRKCVDVAELRPRFVQLSHVGLSLSVEKGCNALVTLQDGC